MATIRVKEKTYRELHAIAGRLQTRLKKPVSADDALDYLVRRSKLKPSDFEGSWVMSDREEQEILKQLRKRWSEWKSSEE